MSRSDRFALRPDAPPEARRGPFAVGYRTHVVVNPRQPDFVADPTGQAFRDRRIKVHVWYPTSDTTGRRVRHRDTLGSGPGDPLRPNTPFSFVGDAWAHATPLSEPRPLVVLSHGNPGSGVLMTWLTGHLASHGHVVAAIEHPRSTHWDKGPFSGVLYHRPHDILRVMEALADSPDVDGDHVVLIGYSMGGYGVLNAAGCGFAEALIAHPQGVPGRLLERRATSRISTDPRIRAVVAFAPWGGGLAYDAESMSALEIPLLLVVGDVDAVSGFDPGVNSLYQWATRAPKRLVVYRGCGHSVAVNPPPAVAMDHADEFAHYADAVWDSHRLLDLNRAYATTWLADPRPPSAGTPAGVQVHEAL